MKTWSLLPPHAFDNLYSNSNARFINYYNHKLTFLVCLAATSARTILEGPRDPPHQSGAPLPRSGCCNSL
jgi:hypothetical protein